MNEHIEYVPEEKVIASWRHDMWFDIRNLWTRKTKQVRVKKIGERNKARTHHEPSSYSFVCEDTEGKEIEVTIEDRPLLCPSSDWSEDPRGTASVDDWAGAISLKPV